MDGQLQMQKVKWRKASRNRLEPEKEWKMEIDRTQARACHRISPCGPSSELAWMMDAVLHCLYDTGVLLD